MWFCQVYMVLFKRKGNSSPLRLYYTPSIAYKQELSSSANLPWDLVVEVVVLGIEDACGRVTLAIPCDYMACVFVYIEVIKRVIKGD